MMQLLIIAPVILPLGTAILAFIFTSSLNFQRWLSLISFGLQLAVSLLLFEKVTHSGLQVLWIGNWQPPFGINLVIDQFSALMLVTSSLLVFCISIYTWSQGINLREKQLRYYPLIHLLFMGISGSFITGDLFNLYVFFEIMLMASFVLMSLEKKRSRIEGAIKYVTLNLLSSAFFLAALGLLYGNLGTLNIADLAQKISLVESANIVMPAVLISIAFGIKSGVFPLYFWLPASYPQLPSAMVALFGGLLTKVGVYAMFRVWTIIFRDLQTDLSSWFIIIACLTMIIGVFGAIVQYEIKKLLSFHIISQIGYMILGLGIFSKYSIAAAIFFIIHNMIAKTNLYLVGGVFEYTQGTTQLKKIGGYVKLLPFLSIIFLISALGLAGIPPLSGFFAKFLLIKEVFIQKSYIAAAIALGVGILTLFSMLKIWAEAFWKKAPQGDQVYSVKTTLKLPKTMYISMSILASATVLMGIEAQTIFSWTLDAAEVLNKPEIYIDAVLKNPL
ncbi:MAG: Na+/H+ antiporter subunit D [Deltaproteobacteria bacterium]|nr:Na+/H+ antiporter subunit D [Deltaproteobacteria bacterium]